MNAELAIPDAHSVPSEIIVFDEGASKGAIIRNLATRIPQNEYGLPIFFFRSDLIHGTHLDDDSIQVATVGLHYFHGYPTLENGSSFWNQLPHEPRQYFELFQKYLDQAYEIGIRQLDALAATVGMAIEELADLASEFFWSARARAHDLFIVAAEAKRRQHITRKMENTHFNQAEAMFGKLMDRFKGEFDDWIEELNAKEAIEVMETLVKIQRMSVGLTGQNASSAQKEFGAGESPESMIRKLAQGGGISDQTADSFSTRLQQLIADPEAGMEVQALILKMTSGNNRARFNEEL